jgi:hypothetical protein
VQVHAKCATMTALVQRWGGRMPFNRALASVTWVALGVSAAFAQVPPKLPACSQSMIVGTWQALFAPGPSNPLAPGFPIYPIFACPVTISTDGSLSTGDCTLNDNFTLTQPGTATRSDLHGPTAVETRSRPAPYPSWLLSQSPPRRRSQHLKARLFSLRQPSMMSET